MFLLKKYTTKGKSILVAFLLSVAGIFYYSWLPNPTLDTETYLPLWIRNWSNTFYNLRTAVPFFAFGYLLEAWFFNSNRYRILKKNTSYRFYSITISIVVILIAEGGQFFLEQRHPDVMDVFFGVLGSVSGMLFYQFISILFGKK